MEKEAEMYEEVAIVLVRTAFSNGCEFEALIAFDSLREADLWSDMINTRARERGVELSAGVRPILSRKNGAKAIEGLMEKNFLRRKGRSKR